MKFSSADFMKLTVQDAVDFLIENENECAVCKGKDIQEIKEVVTCEHYKYNGECKA